MINNGRKELGLHPKSNAWSRYVMGMSIGCGVQDSCPFPLVRKKILIEDWDLRDPTEKDITVFRQVRDEIEQKIKALAEKIGEN